LAALIADCLGIGLWLVDGAERTLYRNASLCAWVGEIECLAELDGYLPGVPLTDFVRRVRRGEGPVDEPAVLLRRPGRRGRLLELRLETGPLPDSLLIALRDVTDRARVQRLGALVETAMALGHEIANPLAILRGEIELLAQEAPAASARLTRMLRSVDRIDDVLRRLRKLAEPGSTAYLPSRGVRMVSLDTLDADGAADASGATEGAR
jgi:nitrogen-specific signal transduction histidine kinase